MKWLSRQRWFSYPATTLIFLMLGLDIGDMGMSLDLRAVYAAVAFGTIATVLYFVNLGLKKVVVDRASQICYGVSLVCMAAGVYLGTLV